MSTSISNKPEYSVDQIRFRLQNHKLNFKVIDNDTSTFKSKCWQIFGFPARKNETNEYQRIPGFVSCRKCFKTYSYKSTTGTRQLNSHPCVPVSLTESKSSTIPTKQTTLDHIPKNLKQIKLDDKEINNFKILISKWICEDLRPFTVVEDGGLRKVFQELISLGKFVQLLCIIIFLLF